MRSPIEHQAQRAERPAGAGRSENLGAFVASEPCVDREHQDVFAVIAGLLRPELPERAKKQAGSD